MKADLLIAKINYVFRIILLIIMLLVFTAGIISGKPMIVKPFKSLPDKTKVNYNTPKPDGWFDFDTIMYPEIKQGYYFELVQDIHNYPADIHVPIKYQSAILPTQTEIKISRKKKYIRATHLRDERRGITVW